MAPCPPQVQRRRCALGLDQTEQVIGRLGDKGQAIRASLLPNDASLPREPGVYGWWADEKAQAAIERALRFPVGGLVYVGQAGAGTSATLASRILGNHITGSMRRSTFRRTVGAILQADRADRGDRWPGQPTEDEVTLWIRKHLLVVAVPVHDRSLVADAEEAALRHYDPPLNLRGMQRSAPRARLTALRAAIIV